MKKVWIFAGAIMVFAVALNLFLVKNYEQASDLQKIKPKFELVDMHNKPVTLDTYKGERLFIGFGYLNCVDVCPVTMATMTNLLYELEEKNPKHKYRALFITVDPSRDTPEKLRDFITELYHPDIVGLSGTEQQVLEASQSFNVRYEKYGETTDGFYSMVHNTYLFAVDEKGDYQTYVSHIAAPPNIVKVLEKYWDEF